MLIKLLMDMDMDMDSGARLGSVWFSLVWHGSDWFALRSTTSFGCFVFDIVSDIRAYSIVAAAKTPTKHVLTSGRTLNNMDAVVCFA